MKYSELRYSIVLFTSMLCSAVVVVAIYTIYYVILYYTIKIQALSNNRSYSISIISFSHCVHVAACVCVKLAMLRCMCVEQRHTVAVGRRL